MSTAFDPQFQQNEAALFARSAARSVSIGSRTAVVNRTHRIVRERAKAMQARRSRVLSLLVPIGLCSVLLLLTGLALWSGLYQYEGATSDVASIASAEANNHFLLVLLWFVPVSVAVLATVWFRRSRTKANDEAF